MLRTGRALSRAVQSTARGRKYLSTNISNSTNAGRDGGTPFGTKLLYMLGFLGVLDVGAATGLAYQMENDPQWEKLTELKRDHPETHSALALYHGLLVSAGLFKGANLNKDSAVTAVKIPVEKQNYLVKDAEDNAKNNKESVIAMKEAAASKKAAAAAKAQADAIAAQAAADALQAVKKAEEEKAALAAVKLIEAKAAKIAQEEKQLSNLDAVRRAKDDKAAAVLAAPLPEVQAVKPASHKGGSFVALPPVQSEKLLTERVQEVSTPVVEAVLSDLSKQTIDLRKELEATLLSDLYELDENALRTRVTQLAAEFFERTKWEGVRVHQSIKQVEYDLTRKFTDILKQQRSELELETNKLLLVKEHEAIVNAYNEAKEQVASHEKFFAASVEKMEQKHAMEIGKVLAEQAIALTDDMQDRLNNEVANLRAMHVKEQLATQAKLSSLEAELAAFQEITVQIGGINEASANVHRFSSAVLNLQNALHAGAPLHYDAAAVAKYADSDPLVNAVLSSLPEALLQQGAPSTDELKTRFNVVRQELRKVAMAPEALPPVLGQAIGSVLSKFYWQPSGPITGMHGAIREAVRRAFAIIYVCAVMLVIVFAVISY